MSTTNIFRKLVFASGRNKASSAANKINPTTQIPQPTTINDDEMDAMDDVYGNLLEQKESKSTDIERSPVEEEKKKKKTVSPEKEKKKKKKTVSPEKAAKKKAKKAWEYAKEQLAKPGPESDGIVGPDDVKEISHITAVQAKLAAFKYSSAEYTTRDHDAKKLLALDGMQQGLTALTNVVNTAIVTSGSAKLASTDGMFHHADVDFVLQ